MRGNIRKKRTNVWEIRIDAGRDPSNGKRSQLSKTVHGSRKEAERVLNEIISKHEDGRLLGSTGKFEELCLKWLEGAEGDLSPSTIRSHRELLKNHVLPGLGWKQVRKIGTYDLDVLYHALRTSRGLSPNSIRRIHAVISGAFNQGVQWKWLSENPAVNASPPRQTKPKIAPPDLEMAAKLLNCASEIDPAFGRFLHLAATTGARRGELCAIRWRNVDLKKGSLVIGRAIIDTKGGSVEKDTKTHSIRRLALDVETVFVLKNQYDAAEELARQMGEEVSQDAFIFSHEPDGSVPWRPDFATKRFSQAKACAGITNVRLHDLRHFAATRMLAAGTPVRTVSGRLGHANASTTLSVYAHFVEESDHDAADILGALISDAKRRQKSSE